ncbi:MAG: hypothetical protein Q9181_007084 [Wetmoreana brouardii]
MDLPGIKAAFLPSTRPATEILRAWQRKTQQGQFAMSAMVKLTKVIASSRDANAIDGHHSNVDIPPKKGKLADTEPEKRNEDVEFNKTTKTAQTFKLSDLVPFQLGNDRLKCLQKRFPQVFCCTSTQHISFANCPAQWINSRNDTAHDDGSMLLLRICRSRGGQTTIFVAAVLEVALLTAVPVSSSSYIGSGLFFSE